MHEKLGTFVFEPFCSEMLASSLPPASTRRSSMMGNTFCRQLRESRTHLQRGRMSAAECIPNCTNDPKNNAGQNARKTLYLSSRNKKNVPSARPDLVAGLLCCCTRYTCSRNSGSAAIGTIEIIH